MCFQDRFDRLFFCGIDERAGVYHQDVGVVSRGSDLHPALQNASEHDLGIDQIFGASEADHADFSAHGGTLWWRWLFDGDVYIVTAHRFSVFGDSNRFPIQNSNGDLLTVEFNWTVGGRNPAFERL